MGWGVMAASSDLATAEPRARGAEHVSSAMAPPVPRRIRRRDGLGWQFMRVSRIEAATERATETGRAVDSGRGGKPNARNLVQATPSARADDAHDGVADQEQGGLADDAVDRHGR